MTYKILDLSKSKDWINLIKKLPVSQQDIYYTPMYYQLYESIGDGKAQCFVFEKDNEIALYPFLMNTINNLGYKLDKTYNDIQGAYGYNGVISSSSKSDFIDSFYNAFNEWCKVNSIIAEFTRLNPYLENHNFSKEHLHIILNRKTVVLNLNDTLENLWEKAFSSKTRNMIRKGLKKNYIVTTDNTEKGVMDFYRIYLETMMGIEANPYYYFNKDMFMEMLKSPSFHFLFVDDKDNNRVATIILMVFGKYAHYHLSGRDIEKADNSVNNYLLYEAIKIAKNKGAKIFHLGGGNALDEKDSLFRFKKGFSKSYLNFYIGKKIHNQEVYDQVISQWSTKYPDKTEKFKNHLLKYRY